jgi:hypothetical protein
MFKELSPVSIAVGVFFGLAALALLWPVDGYGTGVLLLAFCIGAGGWELFRRMRPQKPAPPAPRKRARRR